jgi:hypothetical protein
MANLVAILANASKGERIICRAPEQNPEDRKLS